MPSIYIGFDPREAAAFAVTRQSVRRHVPRQWLVNGLVLSQLKASGLYNRPMLMRPSAADKPLMWDVISDAPMSTEHANARFLVPHLAKTGWSLFLDGDMLARKPLSPLLEGLDKSKAVYCVHHRHEPKSEVKMDGQAQTQYARKNWTSLIAFNCDHEANKTLTLEMVNTFPGRDLHRLCWLNDEEIGEFGPEWNFLVGHSDQSIDPAIVHFTSGTPDMPGYEDVPFADEWRAERELWAAQG